MKRGWMVAACLTTTLASACGGSNQGTQEPGTQQGCQTCHGNTTASSPTLADSAPPIDTAGHDGSDVTFRGVGAHQKHVVGSNLTAPIPCATCHVVPGAASDAGHMDHPLPAALTFTGLALGGGVQPTLDRPAADQAYDDRAPVTCRNVYCHGATLTGGQRTAPVWNQTTTQYATCDSCHGFPPPAPHPNSLKCAACHPDTVSVDGSVKPEHHANGQIEKKLGACNSCHGNAAGSPTSPPDQAPPTDQAGGQATTLVSVGAHQSHLTGTDYSSPVTCDQCHVVPATVDDPNHIDNATATVTFGSLAVAGGATPTWDRTAATCAKVYCHGATLGGGANTKPVWTKVDGSQANCGDCHSLPPPAPHPASDQCASCHSDTMNANGSFKDKTKHIDGKVEVVGAACNTCHGSTDSNAPPKDTHGNTATTEVTVGAHQSHLKASALSDPIACNDCHVVPTELGSPGHIDNPTATVTFANLATSDGATPAWDRTKAQCTNVYCHGATLGGGALTVPTWTKVDGTQVVCGNCHGLPPGAPHPQMGECSTCHTETVNPDRTILNPSKHIDGKVEVTLPADCSTCHGTPGKNAAPPVDTHGKSDTTLVTVGAHQSHLDSPLSSPVACGACHVVPSSTDDPGHIDNATATVTFSGLAKSDGATPAWDEGTATCSGAYCHGAMLTGGVLTTPKWTKVDGTQAKCGNCHSLPPSPPHVQSKQCEACHVETAGPNQTIAHPEKHIDGKVEVTGTTQCNACHGSADNNAPPVDTHGNTSTTLVTVGAHQSHLNESPIRIAVPCDQCHKVPSTIGDPDHINGPTATLTFGSLATNLGATPTWTEGTATCSGVYCHGATLAGGTLTTPQWTKVDQTQAKCGNCHSLPPPSPHPQPATDCATCHGETMNADGSFKDKSKHIDGQVQVLLACNSCHGSSLTNLAPPKDTHGNVATTFEGVGAHQSHLFPATPISAPVACNDCHVVPANVGDPGHIDQAFATLTFGALSHANGAAPAWSHATATCNGVYCHGATLPGGGGTPPVWTQVDGTQAACGTCHGIPPASPHPARNDCSTCHPATVNADKSFKDVTRHIDGTVEVVTACNSCHGNALNNAPPTDLAGNSATNFVGVGAHQSHLLGSANLTVGVTCDQCHKVPGSINDPTHIDGTVELTWGSLATSGGAAPAFNTGTAQCANVYCHGATLNAGGSNHSPQWTQVNGTQAACGTCHGAPPPSPHPVATLTTCINCHPATMNANGTIKDKTKHINGALELTATCNACHGNALNNAPPTDLAGNSATTSLGVGAHQSHLLGSGNLTSAVACDQCHKVPTSVNDPTHIDGTVEMTWGSLATSGGAAPAFNTGTAQCANVYCHGATLNAGGSNHSPQWTQVNGTQAACGTCHAVPPPSPHPAASLSTCIDCHPATMNANGTIKDKTKHINGALEVNVACNTCHGGANNAPPNDLGGNSATTFLGVGAHQSHLLMTGGLATPVTCNQCHKVPANVTDAGHMDGTVELTWGSLATTGGAAPSFSLGGTPPATAQCSNVYCHGSTLNGGTNKTPKWTTVDGSQDACGTCHATPPSTGRHPPVWNKHLSMGKDCTNCHSGETNTAGTLITNAALHVNGVKDVKLKLNGTWDPVNKTCNVACHDEVVSWN